MNDDTDGEICDDKVLTDEMVNLTIEDYQRSEHELKEKFERGVETSKNFHEYHTKTNELWSDIMDREEEEREDNKNTIMDMLKSDITDLEGETEEEVKLRLKDLLDEGAQLLAESDSIYAKNKECLSSTLEIIKDKIDDIAERPQ